MEYLDIKSRIERISREITELKKMLINVTESYIPNNPEKAIREFLEFTKRIVL